MDEEKNLVPMLMYHVFYYYFMICRIISNKIYVDHLKYMAEYTLDSMATETVSEISEGDLGLSRIFYLW